MRKAKTDENIWKYALTAKACEFANHDLKDLQEAAYTGKSNPKVKNLIDTIKAFINFEYAKRERHYRNASNNEGVAVAKYAKHILLTHCDAKDILKIKNIVPRWFQAEERWGWTATYY